MLFFIFIAAYLGTWYSGMNKLKSASPKDFEYLGGDKAYFWPPSQQTAQAYFLICGYFSIWQKLGNYKWVFVLNTILGWGGLVWLALYFYGLLFNT